MEEPIITAQEMIMLAVTNIDRAEIEKNNKLLKVWRTTLESIRSAGPNGNNLGTNLYSHTHIIDLKNGILLIEADHPGWIQTLRLYQKYILTGLKRGASELSISSLAFRLRGSNVELHSKINEEKARSDIEKRINREEKMIQNFDDNHSSSINNESPAEKKEIPENLQKILDRLKSDILTDSK